MFRPDFGITCKFFKLKSITIGRSTILINDSGDLLKFNYWLLFVLAVATQGYTFLKEHSYKA